MFADGRADSGDWLTRELAGDLFPSTTMDTLTLTGMQVVEALTCFCLAWHMIPPQLGVIRVLWYLCKGSDCSVAASSSVLTWPHTAVSCCGLDQQITI